MAQAFSVALLANPRAYAGGEAAFVFEPGTGIVRSAIVTRSAAIGVDHLDVRYGVPESVAGLFGATSKALYKFSRVGIDEAVPAECVHAVSDFAGPAPADGSLAAGLVVVFLRSALFRVTLAVLAEPVPADADPTARFATRTLESDRTGARFEESGPPWLAERTKFVSAATFGAALEASLADTRPMV